MRIADLSGTAPGLNGVHRFSHFSPAVGLTFNPVADLTLYSSYSEGMRAPTAIELTCADPTAPCKLPNSFLADPPLNTIELIKSGSIFTFDGKHVLSVPAHLSALPDGPCTVAFQPHHLSFDRPFDGATPLTVKTAISEIAGSESFIHVGFSGARWVMRLPFRPRFPENPFMSVSIRTIVLRSH